MLVKLIPTATASLTQTNGTGLDARFEEFRKGAVNKIELQIPDDSTNVGGRGFHLLPTPHKVVENLLLFLRLLESREASKLNGMRVFCHRRTRTGPVMVIFGLMIPPSKTAPIYRDPDGAPRMGSYSGSDCHSVRCSYNIYY